MQIISSGDNLHGMSNYLQWRQFAWNVGSCCLEKKRKKKEVAIDSRLPPAQPRLRVTDEA